MGRILRILSPRKQPSSPQPFQPVQQQHHLQPVLQLPQQPSEHPPPPHLQLQVLPPQAPQQQALPLQALPLQPLQLQQLPQQPQQQHLLKQLPRPPLRQQVIPPQRRSKQQL